jgi:MerR family transcriptional regulator, thiopeptide resistance regulator
MNGLNVSEVARLSGVSVRTLHHYDDIGLLSPARQGGNGYRVYEREDLLRLQQILLHRDLGMPLDDIRRMLDAPAFDRLQALETQKQRLLREADRYRRLVQTIDRTIADLKGERAMRNNEMYRGFAPEKQAGYESWLIQRYGGDMPERISASRRKFESLSDEEKRRLAEAVTEIEGDWAEAMRQGVPADSPSLSPLLERHRDWVASMWARDCPPEAYGGLADLHLSHPDFVARYEALEPGFADYHARAMKAYAARLAG